MASYNPQANREWWAQRWFDVLESFGRTLRSARAHTYAREGNVLSIEFRGPKVLAQVQGTAPEPYQVSISLDPFDDEQWSYVIETMSKKAMFSAKLLAGEMPRNIEAVFTANGLSLFPLTKFDIHSRCNCPDKANPCKHIGAVYYLLGDRFGDDPFVLFQLRGRTKEEVIAGLRHLRGAQREAPAAEAEKAMPEGLAAPDLERFWSYDAQLEPSLVVIAPPLGADTVLQALGPIPLAAEGPAAIAPKVALDYLEAIYQAASQQAVMAAMQVGNDTAD